MALELHIQSVGSITGGSGGDNSYCVVLFRDKKNRREKKGQNNAQTGSQNGCTSPSHDSNEADPMPVIDTSNTQSVR